MMSTTQSYTIASSNLGRMQAMTAQDPIVKTATTYYTTHIGKVQSIDAFVKDYRLLSYALTAYGLGEFAQSPALVKKVLEGGVNDSKSLANTLPNQRWFAFAQAFDFKGKGVTSISTPTAITSTVNLYTEQMLETNQGKKNPGVQLALYFQRMAPNLKNAYQILADKQALSVVQTLYNLSPSMSMMPLETQAALLNKVVDFQDFQDPQKVGTLMQRFTALYDKKNGGVLATHNLNSPILNLFNDSPTMSTDLLLKIQSLPLGGR